MMSIRVIANKAQKEKEQKEVSDNCENACCSSGISQSQLDSGLVR